MRDAMVDEESKQQIKELCTQCQSVFLVALLDIGKTGFSYMDIDTGQPTYLTKALYITIESCCMSKKQKELLEKAGIIVRSVHHGQVQY